MTDPQSVYVFDERTVALSFRKYATKCLRYGRQPKLYAKYKTKLQDLLKKNSDKIKTIPVNQAKLFLVRWTNSVTKVRFTNTTKGDYGKEHSEYSNGYLVSLDIRANKATGC